MHRRYRRLVAAGLVALAACSIAACAADGARARVEGATDRAKCMASGARATFGAGTVDEMRAAGADLGALGDLASAKGDELRAALDGCVDVEQTLTDALVEAGLSDAKAACVAGRALRDDEVIGPLLVSMVFGDPGITTAVAIAVRAGGPCLSADDLDRVLPG